MGTSFTHFFAPLLVRRRKIILYCGDVVLLDHGVGGASFSSNARPGQEVPPCSLARNHCWYLPNASHVSGTHVTAEKGSLVYTFAPCVWLLRRDEDGPSWTDWDMPYMCLPRVWRMRWSKRGFLRGAAHGAQRRIVVEAGDFDDSFGEVARAGRGERGGGRT